MSATRARQYHYEQAKSVVDGIERILNRINPQYTPIWMQTELQNINHKAQCILAERKRILDDFGKQKVYLKGQNHE